MDNKEKLKEAIQRFKQKQKQTKIGGKNSKDSEKKTPQSKDSNTIRSKKHSGETKPVLTGPHGGAYTQGDTGKKQYLQSESTRVYHRNAKKSISEDSIKDLLKSIVDDNEIHNFVRNFRLEKTKKFKECVSQVKASGKPESNAYAICTASLGKEEAHPKSEKNKKGKK